MQTKILSTATATTTGFGGSTTMNTEHHQLLCKSALPTTRKSDKENQQDQNSTRYKTELCRSYQENGNCKYGEKCQFAHGENELRNMNRHPKYKTEQCRTFHATGYCPYGPRCHFVHDSIESRMSSSKQAHSKHQQSEKLQFTLDDLTTSLLTATSKQQQQQCLSSLAGTTIGTPTCSSTSITPPSSRSISPDSYPPAPASIDMTLTTSKFPSVLNRIISQSSSSSSSNDSYLLNQHFNSQNSSFFTTTSFNYFDAFSSSLLSPSSTGSSRLSSTSSITEYNQWNSIN